MESKGNKKKKLIEKFKLRSTNTAQILYIIDNICSNPAQKI